MKTPAIACIAAFMASPAIFADDKTWVSDSDGTWDSIANWSDSILPSDDHAVTIAKDVTVSYDYGQGNSSSIKTLDLGSANGTYLDLISGTLDVGSLTESRGLYMSSVAGDYSKITIGGTEDNFATLKVAHKSTGSDASGPFALSIGREGESDMDVVGYGRVEVSGKVGIGGDSYSAAGKGTLNLSGNSLFTTAESGSDMFVGSTGQGYLNISDSAKLNLAGFQNSVYVGSKTGSYGEINMTGSSELYASWGVQIGWDGEGKVFVNDNAKLFATRVIEVGLYGKGYLELNDSAYVETINNLFVGRYSGSEGEIVINGGSMVIDQDAGDGYGFLILGYQGEGSFTINDGSLTMKNAIYVGYEAGSNGTANFNGGTVETKGVLGRNGTGVVNFDGGTLKAADTSYTNFINNTTVNLLSGGVTIDTNSQNLRINSAMTGTGSLTKTGAGDLSLTQANAISGNIIANAGGIVAANADALGSGIVYVNSGASLDSTVATANAGGIQIDGGTLKNNGDTAGEYYLTKDFVLNTGKYELTILSPSEFDTIKGNGANSFRLNGGTVDLSGSVIDYYLTYQIFEDFLNGTVDDSLAITGYDSANWKAIIDATGLLYFTQVVLPEPSTYAAILGFAALLFAAKRRRN